MELKGRTAIITGGAIGIGNAIAMMFAKEGAKILIFDINLKTAKSKTTELRKSGYIADFVVGNVCIKKDVENMAKLAKDFFGKIDILVNNAGLAKLGPIDEISEEDWDICIDTDVKGLFLCTQAIVKVMKKQKSGCILNISSIHGLQGMPERGPYSVAKAGVINLTSSLAAELGRWKIRVNCIAPSFTWTSGFKHMVSLGVVNPEELTRRTPLGELAYPKDIANTAVFLASDKAKYITGITIPIDGGWLADGGRGMARPSDQKNKKKI